MWNVLQPIQQALIATTAPLRTSLTEALHRLSVINGQLSAARQKLVELQGTLHMLKGRDPKGLAIRAWQRVVVLAVLFGLDFALNYLAAEGLLADRYTTFLVALAFTALQGWLAWAFAREAISRRRDALAGEPRPKLRSSWLLLHGGALLAYIVGTTILREKYLSLNEQLAESLGVSQGAMAPWVVSLVLTAVSVALLVLAAYVLAHVDDEVAKCESQIKETDAQIQRFERSERAGNEHRQKTLRLLGEQVMSAHAQAMLELRTSGQLEGEAAVEAATSDYVLRLFWVAATGDIAELPDNPSGSAGPPPAGGKHSGTNGDGARLSSHPAEPDESSNGDGEKEHIAPVSSEQPA